MLSFITLINTILRGEFTESLDSTRGLDLRFAHGLRDLFDRFHFFFDFPCRLFSISDQKIDDLFLGHGIKNDLDFQPSSSLNRSLSTKTRNRIIPFLTYPYSLPYPNLLPLPPPLAPSNNNNNANNNYHHPHDQQEKLSSHSYLLSSLFSPPSLSLSP